MGSTLSVAAVASASLGGLHVAGTALDAIPRREVACKYEVSQACAQANCAIWPKKLLPQLVWSTMIFQPWGPLRQTSEKMPSSLVASPLAARFKWNWPVTTAYSTLPQEAGSKRTSRSLKVRLPICSRVE